MKKALIVILVVVFALSLAATGIGCKAGAPAAEEGKDVEIVFVHKLLGIPWIFRETLGVEEAGEELGIKASLTAPQISGDVVQQVKIVEDLVARGVSGIVVVPVDPASMVPVFKKAAEKGIIVISSESENQEGVVWDVEPFENFAYGQWQMDMMVEYMGEEGNIATFTGELPPGTPALNIWIDGALDRAASEYPGITEVTERLAMHDNAEDTYNLTIDLINTYPELTGILTTGATGAPGAAKAVEEKGLSDQIVVGGTSIPSMCAQYLDSGSLKWISAWDPADLGFSLVYIVNMLVNGEDLSDGMDIPRLGKILVKDKNAYGDAQKFWTKDDYADSEGEPLF